MRRAGEAWVELALFAGAALLLLAGFGFEPAAGAGFDVSRREAGTLRIVTWNVGRGGGPHGQALDDAAIVHVADVIVALDPDLVFLQELEDRRQLEILRRRLGEHWSAAIARPGSRRVAALAPRGELRARRLAGQPGRSLVVSLALPRGRELLALGLHASAWSSAERNAELGAGLDALLAAEGAPARLLVGDLNLDLDLDKRSDLFSDDAHRDVETYNYIADRLLDAARGAGFTAEPDRRLDYVFVSVPELRVSQAGPWRGKRVGGMDHEPLAADLWLE